MEDENSEIKEWRDLQWFVRGRELDRCKREALAHARAYGKRLAVDAKGCLDGLMLRVF